MWNWDTSTPCWDQSIHVRPKKARNGASEHQAWQFVLLSHVVCNNGRRPILQLGRLMRPWWNNKHVKIFCLLSPGLTKSTT